LLIYILIKFNYNININMNTNKFDLDDPNISFGELENRIIYILRNKEHESYKRVINAYNIYIKNKNITKDQKDFHLMNVF